MRRVYIDRMNFLAQADTFSDIFWMSIGFIFLAAIIGAVFANRRRDRCLKLMDDDHVTMQTITGRSIWGDVHVYGKGVEVHYDAPYKTASGLVKASYLMYDDELPNMLALIRYVGGLTEKEARQRTRQVKARFKPSMIRRSLRWVRNMFNTVRDAGTKALSAIVGQLAKANPGTAVSQSTGEVNQIGQTIITNVGYSYEPMLERHIGTPVILEMASPADPKLRSVELPGYLAEYSDKFVAVFNVEQPLGDPFEHVVSEPINLSDLAIEPDALAVKVTNPAAVPLVIEEVRSDEAPTRSLAIVLTQGASARLTRLPGTMTLVLRRAQYVDVICPRQYARVRHASADDLKTPEPSNSLPPAHEDQQVQFP
jgi:hypothetical protein